MRRFKETKTSVFGIKGRVNHNSSKFYNSKLYKELEVHQHFDKKENEFPKELQNKIFFGSADKMKEIPDNSVHLVITSPPYNVSKEYDRDLSLKEYLQFLESSFKEIFRVLVNGGRVCINIANLGRKPYIPLSSYISRIMIDIGYYMRGEIIWNKGASAGTSTAWGSWQSASNPVLRDMHEYILIFSKRGYGRKKGKKEDTITKEQFIEWTKSIWTIKAESAKRIGHPSPFPVELPYRLIQLYSFKGDIVLDPFMGSGTTAIAAIKSERKFVGYEISKEYIDLAWKRLQPYFQTNKKSFEK